METVLASIPIALGIVFGGAICGLFYAVIALWIKIGAMERSTHTIHPVNTEINDQVKAVEDEMHRILGTNNKSDIYKGGIDPEALANFEPFDK